MTGAAWVQGWCGEEGGSKLGVNIMDATTRTHNITHTHTPQASLYREIFYVKRVYMRGDYFFSLISYHIKMMGLIILMTFMMSQISNKTCLLWVLRCEALKNKNLKTRMYLCSFFRSSLITRYCECFDHGGGDYRDTPPWLRCNQRDDATLWQNTTRLPSKADRIHNTESSNTLGR